MNCRGCAAADLATVLDLGDHYLPDFPDPGTPRGISWPLELVLCDRCGLLQLGQTVPRDELYHDRYGFRSGVNEAIRADLESVVHYALEQHPGVRNWLDIACNDGTLLSFVPSHITRTGIDPLKHLAPAAVTHADKVISDYFRPDYFNDGEFDVITSVSMFYDLDDPGQFAAGVARVLAPDGIWVIQQNYAADMITRNAVDNICHEHVTYFAVRPLKLLLERHGLEVIDVAYSDVNGGCVRTLIQHRLARPALRSVTAALLNERLYGLSHPQTWRTWGASVRAELGKTRQALEDLVAAGKRCYLYGASTRGGTFLQMIGAGPDLLPYAVERSPAKVGKIMAATGIPIISEEAMRADPPQALLVSPWFFRDVFVQREAGYLADGGAMIFPLPRFEVVRG